MSIQATSGDGVIFGEQFISPASVAENGGVVAGSPIINESAVLDTSSKYVDYPKLIQPIATIINGNKKLSFVAVVDTPTDLASGYRSILGVGSVTGRCVEIGFQQNTGKMYAYSSASTTKTSTSAVPSGKHTLEWVFDGTNVYFYTDGIANGSQAFAFTAWTDQTIRVGNLAGGTGEPLLSTLYSLSAFNAVHTAEEVKDLYEADTIQELDHPLIDLPLRSSYYKANGVQLLTDGDMEAADTSAWTSTNTTLSKETVNPHGGTRWIKVIRDGASPACSQTILTIGKMYKVTGWCRGDGTNVPTIYNGSTIIWAGTNSSSWQEIGGNSMGVNFVASSTVFNLYAGATVGNHNGYDDIRLELRENLTDNKGTLGGTAKMGDGSTTTTMPTQLVPKGMSFDGGDALKFASEVIGANDFTAVFLLKRSTLLSGLNQRILSNGKTKILYYTTDRMYLITSDGGTTSAVTSVGAFDVGVQTLVVTRSGVTCSLYVNGMLSGTPSTGGTPVSGDTVLTLGNEANLSNGITASMLDVKIYAYAVTARQAKILHNRMMKSLNV